MTPIEKNIIVVDEQGNEYGATYPRRARGLVKNGRERFVGENKLCLACPPQKYMEDNIMEEKIYSANFEEEKAASDEKLAEAEERTLTAREVFDQIVRLQEQISAEQNSLSHFRKSIEALVDFENQDDSTERISDISDVFGSREQTFFHMLQTYKKMYEDIENK